MTKIHTRIKRRFGLSTHRPHYFYFHVGAKEARPKTFKSEEAAHSWALSHKLNQKQYSLKQVKNNKRYQIVLHN